MFNRDGSDVRTSVQTCNNGVKRSHQYQPLTTNNSAINQRSIYNSGKSSFIKFLNPFSKSSSKSQTIYSENSDICERDQVCDTKKSVKVLKQFWNEQIVKTAKSSEHLNSASASAPQKANKSATLKYFSQSSDSLNRESVCNRAEKSQTLDGKLRLPLDDFNKFKDANFVRNKKIKLLGAGNGSECNAYVRQPPQQQQQQRQQQKLESNVIKQQQQQQQKQPPRYSRPESLNDNHFPQVSATGGKIHWAKRDDIVFAKKCFPTEIAGDLAKTHESVMSVKTSGEKVSASTTCVNGKNLDIPENGASGKSKTSRSDSMTSSVASSVASNGSSSNASRKFSFKTNPATTAAYMNKKLASSGGGSVSKVAQIAQRFNQMIQQDATILEEVKKRGGVVVHRSGGRVFKIKEEKSKKTAISDDAAASASDDAVSLISIGKNSTRRKSTLRKRPSIRIMVESPRKDGNGNVLSKRQLYEANVVNKETIVLKPKVPDKSERVLAKTKELKSRKMLLESERAEKTEEKKEEKEEELLLPKIDEVSGSATVAIAEQPAKDATSKNNFRKIYDKINFRPTFLYGKKSSKSSLEPSPIITAVAVEEAEANCSETAAEAPTNDDISTANELEDEFEFQPIDLNLNVYFNNENLSTTNENIEEIKSISSQGPATSADDDTTEKEAAQTAAASANIECEQTEEKTAELLPNNSFLFRTQPTKFDSACDTFMRGMLNENPTLFGAPIDEEKAECAKQQEENDYEIISRDLHDIDNETSAASECVGIDKPRGDNGCVESDNATRPEEDEEEEIEEENIYQSLSEVKGISIEPQQQQHCDAMSDKSYESFENYDEIKQSILDNRINFADFLLREDDYIVPDSIAAVGGDIPPELPAPRKNTVPKISSPILTSTTSTLVQANFPVPKPAATSNYELSKSNSCVSTTYEKIKYDQLPHAKQAHAHSQANAELPLPPRNNANNNSRDENIYDTIRNYSSGGDSRSTSTEYENIPEMDGSEKKRAQARKASESFHDNDDDDNPYKNSKNDTMSIISNCYESISLKQSYSTINQILRHAISTTTLSSEHRINSIYGIGQSLTPPSDRSGGSDNSDEWIDVESEDEEAADNNDRFIVICKKTKAHRTASDWSRLIRQKLDEWDDDSDHHYESLYSIQQQRAALEGKLESEKPLGLDNGGSNQNYFIEKLDNDDDYSSFESDDEHESESHRGEEGKQQADLRNAKLPEPPTSQASGQVYAIVQRLKNFGSISKIEITKGFSKITKKRASLGKMPTSKFYETSEIVEESMSTTASGVYDVPKYESKSIGKKSRGLSKLSKLGRLTINKLPANFNLSEPFDQSDYQPATTTTRGSHSESNSSLNKLSSNQAATDADVEFQNQKNNKSFKAKFRKSSTPSFGSASTSNIYSSLASKTSTFYVTDSLDVDSGIFAVNEKSTNSPDNSNLNLNVSSSSISCDPKRRSIASLTTSSRPKDSPPPPPSERTRRSGATSWYAECGLFKPEHGEHDEKSDKVSSWYQESGLYQTSNNSVASSSGSSGVSTGGECSPCGDENSHSMFLNEPLYQLYTAAKLESISSSEFEPEPELSDGYEEIHKKDSGEEILVTKKPSRPSALQLIEPNHGPSRTLWSEVHEVIQSGILATLSMNEKKLQEAKFEILTSEASYLKSLNLLKSHFMNHPAFRDPQVLDSQDRKILFSNIIPVQECSDRLLCDLESCWQDSVMLKNLAKHIFKHAERHFHVYISYCEHQGRLDRTLKRLKETNVPFKETLDILENDSICCGLTIHSFLMLPMQRITRLPLLIDAVMTKLKSNDEEFDDWKMAMAIANKIVDQCNQAANRCEQAFEMEMLSKQIEFQQNITPFPLIPFNTANAGNNRLTRTLVKRGELTHIIYRGDDAKLTFGKKATVKKNVYCFLFTDVILLTKKKSEESFVVFDYCQRSLLQVSSGDVIPQFPTKDINNAGKYIMFMSLLENYQGKPVDLILACPSETERQRWLQATTPPTSENPYETLYEQWDCPQVVVKHSYKPIEPDELTLEVGDVVNVLRKMKDDGWYYGERIRDGAQGWFPGNFSIEVHSAHVRARNLKQRHRLLLYTATYLESQKDVNTKRK